LKYVHPDIIAELEEYKKKKDELWLLLTVIFYYLGIRENTLCLFITILREYWITMERNNLINTKMYNK
jgi:hypothetical protein